MKKTFYLLLLILISCSLKQNKTNNFETINIENFSYGKLGISYDEIDSISSIFKISKKIGHPIRENRVARMRQQPGQRVNLPFPVVFVR